MGIAARLRQLVVHGVIVGALALTVVIGLGTHDASAAKSVGTTSCDSLMAGAMYAAGQSSAADRRGDKITSDWWWSIYVSYESAYVKAGCLDETV
ncbi:MAG TPA: hypothetical protein VH482_00100 [Thermomicrobiales bacterium]|jgi:hypothetical protein